MTTINTRFVVIAIFKNETIDMKEWIEHYIWQGASHIFLADNESTDSPLDILQPYIDTKFITYVKIPGNAMQRHVYYSFTKLLQELESPPDWICIADLDEFWFGQEKPMNEVLSDYPGTVHVVSRRWREFGPSEDGFHPPSVRKNLVYRNPNETSPKCCFRTLCVNPENVLIHEVDGVPIENIHYEKELLHIHHYFCRSAEYWNSIKIPRGYAMGDFNVYACENTWRNRSEPCTYLDTNLANRVD